MQHPSNLIPPATEYEGQPDSVSRGHDRRAAFVRFDYKAAAWKAAAYSGPLGDFALRDVALKAAHQAPKRVRS